MLVTCERLEKQRSRSPKVFPCEEFEQRCSRSPNYPPASALRNGARGALNGCSPVSEFAEPHAVRLRVNRVTGLLEPNVAQCSRVAFERLEPWGSRSRMLLGCERVAEPGTETPIFPACERIETGLEESQTFPARLRGS